MTEGNGKFDPEQLGGLDDPVRRYLTRALAPGMTVPDAWSLRMKGSIKVGLRLPFEAGQELDGRSFRWRARVPSNRFPLLEVLDYFDGTGGGMTGRGFGRQLFADTSADAARSAATRAVMESTMVPATLRPGTGIEWTARSETEIRFRRPAVSLAGEVTLRIDPDGRAIEVEAPRWRKEKDQSGGLLPFLCRFDGEREFAGMKVPARMTAGWVEGEFKPFFSARITSVEAISVP